MFLVRTNLNDNIDWVNEIFEWADEYEIPPLEFTEPEFDENGNLEQDGYWFGIPRSSDELINLEELNLNGLIKSDIPDQFRHLKKLKKLSITDGPQAVWGVEDSDKDTHSITEIPEWISELDNLEQLNLCNNSISYIPDSLAKLKNLKGLYLSVNRIEYITQNLYQLKHLESLWLGVNKTTLQTYEIRSLDNLQELWLDGLPGSEYGPITLKKDCVQFCTSDGYSQIPIEKNKVKNIYEALSMIGLI